MNKKKTLLKMYKMLVDIIEVEHLVGYREHNYIFNYFILLRFCRKLICNSLSVSRQVQRSMTLYKIKQAKFFCLKDMQPYNIPTYLDTLHKLYASDLL